jgi:hypothetical protein
MVVQPINISRKEIVEAILAHKGNPCKRKTLYFLAHWLNFPADEDEWLPFSQVRNLQLLDDYIARNPSLSILNRQQR